MSVEKVLEVSDLRTHLVTRAGVSAAVDGVSFAVRRNSTFGLVGESGSGKSVTCLSIMNLLPPNGRITGGSIRLNGEELTSKSQREMNRLRGRRLSMVLQDPMTSLNPLFTIGDQVGEMFRRGPESARTRDKVVAALRRVRIPAPEQRLRSYPHQLSGGMRQRVSIAMNIAAVPDLLLADEPTTALDVTIQLQILQLLKAIQAESGMSIVFVTHNLHVVARFCDEMAVMYAGRIVESGRVEDIFRNPSHPYTRGLLTAMPHVMGREERLRAIPGQPPSLSDHPAGCRFSPRCALATEQCRTSYPPTFNVGDRHESACWLTDTGAAR